MTNPTYFTVIGDYKAIVADTTNDTDANPDLGVLTATVTFTPMLNNGDVILATQASPRPTGFIPAPVTGFIDTDGRLKLRAAANGAYDYTPIRLLAHTPLLNLSTPLIYRVSFSNVTYDNRTGTINSFFIQAPTTDTVVDLISAAPATGQNAIGITHLAPGEVRIDDNGLVQFSFGGQDIPDPLAIEFSTASLADATTIGADLVTAADAATARGVIDAEWPGNKGVSGGYVPLDSSAKIDATYLPSYVDDVLEYANQAAFPGTGETGKIYVAKDTGDAFRWSGSTYIRISDRVTAAGITDSTTVGRAVVTAASTAAARTAIDFAAGVKEYRTVIDLRDWPDVLAANWKTSIGGSFTTGSNTATGTPFTSADVGKIVIAMTDDGSVSGTQTHWMTTITAVSGTTATFADNCPITSSSLRVRYGFDGTTAINSALAEIQARTDGPVDVYLGGNYRLTQLVVPSNVVLRGVSWKKSVVQAQADLSKTSLAQLPGAEKDFVIFGASTFGAGIIAGAGLFDLDLLGPEKHVIGLADATVGNGVSFRTEGLSAGWVIDWFRIHNVSALNFPESGFRCFGAVPMYFNECRAQNNGRFGYEHQWGSGAGGTTGLHILNFSADWNNLGAIGFKNMTQQDNVFITGVKSEGTVTGAEADLAGRGGPGYQSNCIVFDNCDNTVAVINGLSHIRIQRAGTGPGPAILIKDSTGAGKKPRLTFNGVMVRVGGWETAGTTGDAVTLRDAIANVDISHTVTSGTYPNGPTFPNLIDNSGNKLVNFHGYSGAATAYLSIYNAPNFPIVSSEDPTQTNVALSLQTKGGGTVYIDSSSPSITAGSSSGNKSLNLISRGSGSVRINGVDAVDISSDQTLSGKNISGATNTLSSIPQSAVTGLSTDLTRLQNTSGTNTGDQTDITGNAGTASKLQTAHTIDGVSFDGSASVTVIAPGTHAATSKSTPVDDDELPLVDSAASNVLAKLTWANLKAALKAYFDSVSTTLTNKNYISARTATATAAGITTLTSASAQVQEFTGSTYQSVYLPTTGIIAGQTYTIVNNSSSYVSVYPSSGGGGLITLLSGKAGLFTARIDSPTANADWITSVNSTTSAYYTLAQRDANSNIAADNFIATKTATATAAGTTTLTIDSAAVQEFTGSTTQTVKLPTTSVTGGQQYTIINNSSGAVTVQSSGANTIATVAAGTLQIFVAQQSTPTTAAHWRAI